MRSRLPTTVMEAEALNWGSVPSTTYTPESASVTALSVRAPLRMLTDALPLWPGKTACCSSSQATMRDSPTAQLPLLRVVGGNRDSVTVSPTTVVLTDGRTSTEAETRTPGERVRVCYLELKNGTFSFFRTYFLSTAAMQERSLLSSSWCIGGLQMCRHLFHCCTYITYTPTPPSPSLSTRLSGVWAHDNKRHFIVVFLFCSVCNSWRFYTCPHSRLINYDSRYATHDFRWMQECPISQLLRLKRRYQESKRWFRTLVLLISFPPLYQNSIKKLVKVKHQATVSVSHTPSPCLPRLFAYWDCLIALICSSSRGKQAMTQCGSDVESVTPSKTKVS